MPAFVSDIKKRLPFLVPVWKKIKRIYRAVRREIWKLQYDVIQKEDLKKFFLSMGIHPGDALFVHSSLNAMGVVENGAQTVLEALMEILGPEGTLVMPSYPGTGKNAEYVASCKVFDVKNTPSRMGVITEKFRKRKGVFRSAHLTDAVCAFGKHAEWITEKHHLCLRPHEKDSPFERFIRLNGKVLLIGVHLDTLTLLHASEDAIPDFPYPVYLPEPVNYEIINPGGETIKAKTMVHNPDQSEKRKCKELWKHFANNRFAKEYRFRGCTYRLIDGRAMHEWLIKAFYDKKISMYYPDGEK